MDERLRFVARRFEGEKMAPLCTESVLAAYASTDSHSAKMTLREGTARTRLQVTLERDRSVFVGKAYKYDHARWCPTACVRTAAVVMGRDPSP